MVETAVTPRAGNSGQVLQQLGFAGLSDGIVFDLASQLVISLFPGIDMLGKGFEDEGFCVVRGGDLIYGRDVREFSVPVGKFTGVIGGPPCQDFSKARRDDESGNGRMMLAEFERVVLQAEPDWWLMENVPGVPDVKIEGYNWQRLDLTASSFGLNQRRLRHVQFGSKRGMCLVMPRQARQQGRNASRGKMGATVMASDSDTPWDRFCELQGLPAGFDIPAFTVGAKRRAVGNGVPLPMARALATAVAGMVPVGSVKLCDCRCARPVSEKATYAGAACRMRAKRRRDEEMKGAGGV